MDWGETTYPRLYTGFHSSEEFDAVAHEEAEEEYEEDEEEASFKVPRGIDKIEWWIQNLEICYRNTKKLYEDLSELCTAKTCPYMSAGPRYEYLWSDDFRFPRPVRVSAPLYAQYLFEWCDLMFLDYTFGPPEGTEGVIMTVFRRLFRLLAHMYYAHWKNGILDQDNEKEFDRCAKRLLLFIHEFEIMTAADMEPLRPLIAALFCEKPHCYSASGTGLIVAQACQRAEFNLIAMDKTYNPLACNGGDRITCRLECTTTSSADSQQLSTQQQMSPSSFIRAHVQDNDDGTYTVSFKPSTPGQYVFHFETLSGARVLMQSQFKLRVLPSIASDMAKALTNPLFHDITFHAEATMLHAHKIVVCNRLPGHDLLHAMKEIRLAPTARPETWNEFLRFLYTDNVDTENMKNYVLSELLQMAHDYKICRLVNICEGNPPSGEEGLASSFVDQNLFSNQLHSYFFNPKISLDTSTHLGFVFGQNCFNNPRFSDFTFLVGDFKVFAHKIFLAMRSDYFLQLFTANPSLKRQVIQTCAEEQEIEKEKEKDKEKEKATLHDEKKTTELDEQNGHKSLSPRKNNHNEEKTATPLQKKERRNSGPSIIEVETPSSRKQSRLRMEDKTFSTSYPLFMSFLKWVYTDVIEIANEDIEKMLKLSQHFRATGLTALLNLRITQLRQQKLQPKEQQPQPQKHIPRKNVPLSTTTQNTTTKPSSRMHRTSNGGYFYDSQVVVSSLQSGRHRRALHQPPPTSSASPPFSLSSPSVPSSFSSPSSLSSNNKTERTNTAETNSPPLKESLFDFGSNNGSPSNVLHISTDNLLENNSLFQSSSSIFDVPPTSTPAIFGTSASSPSPSLNINTFPSFVHPSPSSSNATNTNSSLALSPSPLSSSSPASTIRFEWGADEEDSLFGSSSVTGASTFSSTFFPTNSPSVVSSASASSLFAPFSPSPSSPASSSFLRSPSPSFGSSPSSSSRKSPRSASSIDKTVYFQSLEFTSSSPPASSSSSRAHSLPSSSPSSPSIDKTVYFQSLEFNPSSSTAPSRPSSALAFARSKNSKAASSSPSFVRPSLSFPDFPILPPLSSSTASFSSSSSSLFSQQTKGKEKDDVDVPFLSTELPSSSSFESFSLTASDDSAFSFS
ncbi:hypothetical protein QOT17_000722 [Balamuthia mandrillaris]